jgi:PleD family two-component response regulator
MKADAPTRVLVIDDDEIARELLGSVLEAAGFLVYSLPSPIGATRVLQLNEVSAIVLDVVMPALSGDRLTTLLRHNPRFAKLAVVLVSGEGDAELSKLASAVGADAVVSKKDIRQSLTTTVKKALRTRAQAYEAAPQQSRVAASNGKLR